MFGTQLFNTSSVVETISMFKVTTIAISVGTYVFALLLVWLADRLERPHAIIRKLRRDFRVWSFHLENRVKDRFRSQDLD